MRVSSFLVFLFVIIVNSQSVPQIVEEIANGVKLLSPGIAQLVLTNGHLDVQVDLKKCEGKVLFCYNSSNSEDLAASLCQSNFCGFKLDGDANRIMLTDMSISKQSLKSCPYPFIRMQHPEAKYCNRGDFSCDPAFDKDNVITIDVRKISPSSCPVTILNAKIYVPPVTTTTTPTSSSTSILSSSTEASITNGTIIWIIIVVVVVVIIIVIIIVVIAVKCYKKKASKKKKRALNQVLEEVVIISKHEEAPDEVKQTAKNQHEKKEVKPLKVEETKKFVAPYAKVPKEDLKKVPYDIKPPKPMPKKETTEATEEPPLPPPLPAPVTESKEPIAEPEVPQKFKQQQNPWAYRLKTASGSSGSRMRGRFKDSVESQRSVNKNTAYEAHYKSMERNGLIGKKMAESFAKDYKPDPKKKLLSVEISLLCNLVGDVFITINHLVAKAIEQLKEHDLKLHEDGRAKKMSKTTRNYLHQPDTPEYIRFTCFALEFGHSIPVDEEHLQKYSMALLLVVGFSLNHPDEIRRHALAIFRRELPFWRRNSTIKERNAFGYPANAMEAAHEMNPDCFNNIKRIQTNSTPNNSEEKRSKSNSNGPSKEAAKTESKEVVIENPSKKKNKKRK